MSNSSGRPRSISNSDGARVKLLLGATGKDYILLLDEDDGKREWQTHDSSGDVCVKVRRQIKNCYHSTRKIAM